MKRCMAMSILFVLWLNGNAQLVATLQLPEAGLVQTRDLWNMSLTNSTSATLRFRVEMAVTDAAKGTGVLRASTQVLELPPGASFFNASRFGAIQYVPLPGIYLAAMQNNGLLPVGRFSVCFSFFQVSGDLSSKISDECQQVIVEPLSPPEPVMPGNGDTIADTKPVFYWLPPQPLNLMGEVSYDVSLVEQLPGQTEVDALRKNIPLWFTGGVKNTTMLYDGPALEIGKQYAWRVNAVSGGNAVSTSNYSRFVIARGGLPTELASGAFVRLRKEAPATCMAPGGRLRFAYFNETGDSTWNVHISDLSIARAKEVPVSMYGIPLKVGENLVELPLFAMGNFVNGHLYRIEVIDSRQQLWQLQFQFLKP